MPDPLPVALRIGDIVRIVKTEDHDRGQGFGADWFDLRCVVVHLQFPNSVQRGGGTFEPLSERPDGHGMHTFSCSTSSFELVPPVKDPVRLLEWLDA